MMELSKPLQEEICKVQNELKSAIQNHQVGCLAVKSWLYTLIYLFYLKE